MFPDKIIDLLFNSNEFTYFDSAEFVAPRERKYVLTDTGVRQLNSIVKIPEKEKMKKEKTSSGTLIFLSISIL
ncbi:hypothetical protein ES703_53938 [subsurface metagenome]